MKKFLSAICAAAVVLTACDPEEAKVEKPSASFETVIPVMSDGTATFKLVVENYESSDPVTIPVTFGGDAVKGEDYTVSAEAFVYGFDSPVTAITLTVLKYGTGKKVSASLALPEGWVAGNYPTSECTLADKLGYVTFQTRRQIMTDKVVTTIEIYDADGNAKKLANPDEVQVSVNTEESTAVEGTHFRFTDGSSAAVAAGSNSGTVTLEMLGEEVVAGNDKIVLNIVTGDKYELGQYGKVEISMAGSEWKKFDGTWVLNQFVTDAAYMQEGMWFTDEEMAGFPVVAEGDSFTIDLDRGVLVPEFTSDLKNFFIGESNITRSEAYTLTAGMGDKRVLQMLELDNTNRNFSASSQSEDKVSFVGARIITDEETSEELLDLYLLDYRATDFLKMYEDYYMYNDTKPMATMTYVFLNLTFKKAE